MWLIALFQVEMMQLTPLGHVDHRMLGVVYGMSEMSESCPGCPVSKYGFTGHFGHGHGRTYGT